MTDDNSGGVVLIVDDTPTNLEVLFETLSSDGFKVLVAVDGESALDQAALAKPDVILLDVMMPDIDGFETCRRLKASDETRDIPVIFMTALSETVDKVRGFELGAVDYITKPFQQKEVSIRVATHVHMRNLQREVEAANVKLEKNNAYLEQRITERTVDLAEANARLRKLNRSYSRFVPSAFLEMLGRKSINDIRLGDQVETVATLMFVGIRGFTRKTEALRPEERLRFLNRYMHHVAPAIREHKGFVDKYVGDSVMALFPYAPEDAVEAANQIHSSLLGFDLEKGGLFDGRPGKLRVGVGLHRGSMLLGTIGEGERMECTVISDVVDCTALLERLTKRFAVDTLLSDPMHRNLSPGVRAETRKIAKVRFDSANDPMDIHELFSSDDEEQRELKRATRSLFEEALAAYENSEFSEARVGLGALLEANPKDRVARRLFRRAQHFLGEGAPPGWSGIYEVPKL